MKFRKVTAAANAKSDEALMHIATFPADPEAKLFLLFDLMGLLKIYIIMDHFNLIFCLIKTMFASAHHQETFLF
jgi:hypothetical protein